MDMDLYLKASLKPFLPPENAYGDKSLAIIAQLSIKMNLATYELQDLHSVLFKIIEYQGYLRGNSDIYKIIHSLNSN